MGVLATALVLFWIVLTRFESGSINAVDFTVYFDRPCIQTIHGHPLFVETADAPAFSQRTELAVHAYWAMLPICGLYWIHPTPQWLLAISVVSVVAGAIYILRIVGLTGGSGILACAAALAFVLNDNTARTLNYGFHPEVLYAWFIPWLLYAGLKRAPFQFLCAAILCAAVKEDACFPLFAAGVALALVDGRNMTWRVRALFLAAPTAIALANLAVYYGYVVPLLTPDGRPVYSSFWTNYGPTPLLALAAMVHQPLRVAADIGRSGFLTTAMPPHLFLPFLGWQWIVGLLPIVAVYGASANEQLRAYGLYYSMALVPFLTLGSAFGAQALARRVVARPAVPFAAAAAIVLGALLVGSTDAGYSLRAWDPRVRSVPAALQMLTDRGVVLVQSALYPHAGYASSVQLLTAQSLAETAGVRRVVLLLPAAGAFPLTRQDTARLAGLASAFRTPGDLVAVPLDPALPPPPVQPPLPQH